MIPKPYIAQWQENAPWKTFAQIEQDLVISRSIIALFQDKFLSDNLAFRGGTALHKLYLSPAPRYSEDIDLVQVKEGAIGEILDRIQEVMDFMEGKKKVKQKAHNNTIVYQFQSEYEEIPLKLKIEINCKEHFNVLGWEKYKFEINNPWFKGEAKLVTYQLDELLGTKLRALYQRSKGRDLFDLYYASQNSDLNNKMIIQCFKEYTKFSVGSVPTKKQYLLNLEEKMNDKNFLGDTEGLLGTGIKINENEAFSWIKENLIELM